MESLSVQYIDFKKKYNNNKLSIEYLENADYHDLLDRDTLQFIQQLEEKGGDPPNKLSVEQARQGLINLQSSINLPPIDSRTITIPYTTSDGLSIDFTIDVIRPPDAIDPLPVLMYFHGGGWILGNRTTHDRLIRELAIKCNAAVVFVNYTPSPEARYPIALEQCYHATVVIFKEGEQYGLDTSNVAIIGDSVGGNLVIGTAVLGKQHGLNLKCCVVFYPVTDSEMNTESYRKYAHGPWLTRDMMEWFWNNYEPNKNERAIDPMLSPLLMPVDIMRTLPPFLIITDENDVLRDEGEEFAHKLMKVGVQVQAVRFLGTVHDFVMLNPLSNTPATRGAIMMAVTYIRDMFQK